MKLNCKNALFCCLLCGPRGSSLNTGAHCLGSWNSKNWRSSSMGGLSARTMKMLQMVSSNDFDRFSSNKQKNVKAAFFYTYIVKLHQSQQNLMFWSQRNHSKILTTHSSSYSNYNITTWKIQSRAKVASSPSAVKLGRE